MYRPSGVPNSLRKRLVSELSERESSRAISAMVSEERSCFCTVRKTACKKAAVHDFIQSLPQGYDTPVGELGSTLSGGERQRLGLARAFLHQGDFLLLDEPTSNLDSLNEAVILRSLGEERGEKTVLLVTHRKSTMRVADTVYNMHTGRMS